MTSQRPLVAVLSGLDPCGASGLFADIRALTAAGVRIAPMVSAVTAQGKNGVSAVSPVPADVIEKQLKILFSEYDVSAFKIGVLGSWEIAEMVAAFLSQQDEGIPVVLDPVKSASNGGALADDRIRTTIVEKLLSHIMILTPNIEELSWLAGYPVDGPEGWMKAANDLLASGCKAVFLKGGHLSGTPEDHLYTQNSHKIFSGSRLPGSVRGTGCHMASFIAARLANHVPIENAVHAARNYVRSLFKNYAEAGAGVQPAWIPEEVVS